jgi:HEAT repeat protein
MAIKEPYVSLAFDRLATALRIQPGEGRLVTLVLAYGFSLGLGRIFTATAISGLFLDRFGAGALPYTFLGTAALVPITGLIYLRLRDRMPYARLVALTIGALLVTSLGFRVVLGVSAAPWIIMTLMIGYTMVYVLISLVFWGLAGQLFNVRQGKRLFGLLGSGSEVADMSGGLLTLVLAPLIGSTNLLLLAGAGLLGALLLQQTIVRRYPLGVDAGETASGDGGPVGIGAIFARGYVRLLVGLIVLSQLGYFFVEAIFYDLSMAYFSGPSQYSALVGATVAASSILTLLLQITAAGPLISRFGLRAGLPALPALLLVGAVAVAGAGSVFGGVFAVFVLMLITRIGERAMRFSIDETAVQIAYQPLPAGQRSLLQTIVDGGVRPLAAGLAGALLLLLTRPFGFDGVQLAWLLALCSAAWLVIAVLLSRGYPAALLRALSGRRLSGADLKLADSDSLAIIRRGLRSPYPGEALYALQLLGDLEHPALPEALTTLLDHPDTRVRAEALRRIAATTPAALHEPVAALLERERDPAVRGAALRTLAALGGGDQARYTAALNDPAPEVRLGAAIALAHTGGGAVVAQCVRAWAVALDPADRALAARTLGALGGPADAAQLRPLLNDPILPVRQAALAAVAAAGDATLWPEVVAALGNPALRAAALAGLVAAGEQALPALDSALGNPALPPALRLQAARALGKLGAPGGACLAVRLDLPDEELRHGITMALGQSGYQADPPAAASIWGRVRAEAAAATWALAVARDLGAAPAYAPLRTALERSALRTRERILALLSVVLDSHTVRQVRDGLLGGGDRQAYAIEALDLLLPQPFRPIVLPLVEAAEPPDALAGLERNFPQERRGAAERIAELCAGAADQVHRWVRICALAASAGAHPTADASTELGLFARVQALGGSAVFRAVPAEELLAVAAILEPVQFPAGAAIVVQGDAGDCAYLIVSGTVRVHAGPQVRNRLEPGELFGELAVLDARPRSLSVTAVEPVALLRLDRAALFDLIADHVAVARGIIGVLIRNLRANVRELGARELQLQTAPLRDVQDDTLQR